MWPIGHGAVAYILYTLSTRERADAAPGQAASILVVFGGVAPDLVDKPLAWSVDVLPAGRSLSHSLLVIVPVVTIVYLLTRSRERGELGVAFGVGALSHPFGDALPVLWGAGSAEFLLWPLLAVESPASDPSVLELVRHSLSNPYSLVEILLLVIALALWRADGYPGLGLVLPWRRDYSGG